MIKYLSCPDIHANKQWMDTTIKILEKIRLTAIKEKVDFIAFPGDLHDTDFYVSDESGYNRFMMKIKELLQVAPICAIEGTPGHEAKGMYSPLEEIGLVLLKPEKVYGYNQNTHKIVKGEGADCLLFGVPELNKNNIMAQLNLPAEQANAKAVDLFGNYIDFFVAPMRLKYKDIPAIGLLHGNVSDYRQENSTDVIIKASDIVIHTETLERAHLDRWSLGHIHTPWESSLINCGYAGYPGVDRNPWGKRDFVPAMNLVEISRRMLPSKGYSQTINIDRIPYGTPMRVKLSKPLPTYDPNIAYWLDTENPDDELPTGHPWNRITYREDKVETRRVTADEAENVKTLWDLFKLIDPNVRPELKELVDSIPARKNTATTHKMDAILTSVKVKGCTLFGGKTTEWNLTDLATGLNQLIGTNGNGDGKSSLLGMCSFYPVVIGKDTKSGRQSALKDFFSGQDSSIEKRGIVNGQNHHHLITIKGAHTQNPKTECYLDIDGIPQLEKATFDTMMEKCEELYGSFDDYLLTTFYEQPQQSKNQRSGLMTATGTDARNLVQNIADIDKESEKRFALDRVAEAGEKINQLESDIRALEEYSEDMEELELKKGIKIDAIVASGMLLKETEIKGNAAKQLVDSLQLKVTKNEKAKTQKEGKEKQVIETERIIRDTVNKIDKLKETIKDLPGNQACIKKDNEALKLKADADKKNMEYSAALNEYNQIINDYTMEVFEQKKKREGYQSTIDNAEIKKQSHNKEIELISEPCPQCGYIKPDVQTKIEELNNSITLLDESIKMSFENIDKLKPITKPTATQPIKPGETHITILSDFERSETEKAITEGLKAETTIEGLKSGIAKDTKLLEIYQSELKTIVIDTLIDDQLVAANAELGAIRRLYSETQRTISTLEAEKKALEDRIKKALEGKEKLTKKKGAMAETEMNRDDWTYIAKMLNPDKIPALELDMVVDSIDSEATRNIKPFLEGRYSFHTETQKPGKKATVDKFDILIHDAETGQSFSMFYTNPGNKAFYSDCYIKALIRKRNERQQRSYSPIIYDEADGPVNPLRVKAYYEIQQEYFRNEKVILVSQKDITASYVEKIFNIEEMKK